MLARKRLMPCGNQSFIGDFDLAGLCIWALARTCFALLALVWSDFVPPDILSPGPPAKPISVVEPLLLWSAEEASFSGLSSTSWDNSPSSLLPDGSLRSWQASSSFVLIAVNYFFPGPYFIGDKSYTAVATDCEVMTSKLGVSSSVWLLSCWFYEV